MVTPSTFHTLTFTPIPVILLSNDAICTRFNHRGEKNDDCVGSGAIQEKIEEYRSVKLFHGPIHSFHIHLSVRELMQRFRSAGLAGLIARSTSSWNYQFSDANYHFLLRFLHLSGAGYHVGIFLFVGHGASRDEHLLNKRQYPARTRSIPFGMAHYNTTHLKTIVDFSVAHKYV